MGKICPTCGGEYKQLGSHITKGTGCDYPEFTDDQIEIIKGMMLGDGWINHLHKGNGNPFFAVGMTNYDFLVWLNEKMRPHSTGVKDASPSQNSTKPYYKVRTMRTPRLDKFAEWYDTGELVLEEIELTPLSLKMWYVSDGTYKHTANIIEIGNKIATDRDDYFQSLFAPLGVNPTVYDTGICFNVEDSKRLIEFMGANPPGFKRKWPIEERAEADEKQVTL
jgi:hypothetical protein